METLPLVGIRRLEQGYASEIAEDVEWQAAMRRTATRAESQVMQKAEVVGRIPSPSRAPFDVDSQDPTADLVNAGDLLFERSEHAMIQLFAAEPLNQVEQVQDDESLDTIQPPGAIASTESGVREGKPVKLPCTQPSQPSEPSEPRADVSGPAWLFPQPQAARLNRSPAMMQGPGDVPESLEHSRGRIATRWFALRSVFGLHDTDHATERVAPETRSNQAPIVAVFSIAGGAGKTSLVATLGRALSFLGERVLLSDTRSYGLLPFYFGASQLVSGVVRTFTPPTGSTDAPIYLLSYDAARGAEEADGEALIVKTVLESSQRANRVLLDLSADCVQVVEHLGRFKPTILVPLLPDMNSVISIGAVEQLFGSMLDAEGRRLQPVYLLNQFDSSLPLHLDIREVLKQQLGQRLLPFVVRRSPAMGEALAEGMTIMDYDEGSAVAEDYLRVANWLRTVSAPAAVGFRNQRWREQ